MIEGDVIAGMDIGSRYIRVLLGEYDESEKLVISGSGISDSEGMRRGVIVNIEAMHEAVMKAVEMAEHQAGRTITQIFTALNGPSVESSNSRGVVAVSSRSQEVRSVDIDRAIDTARTMMIPLDREILHVLPQEYALDDQIGIRNPIDMIGVRLEVEVHIVTALLSAIENMEKAVQRADYRISNIVLGSLAAARVLLTEDEKEMGVLFVNVGANSTDYILIKKGAPRVSGSIPVGSALATGDIAIILKTSMELAERIKLEAGLCWEGLIDKTSSFFVPANDSHPAVQIPVSEICRILRPRMEEIFQIIKSRVSKNITGLDGGVVISGGGAMMAGISELVTHVFRKEVRIGQPRPFLEWPQDCLNPAWSTVTGLVLMGDAIKRKYGESSPTLSSEFETKKSFRGFLGWLGEFF